MFEYRILKDDKNKDVYEINSIGSEILHNSTLNKGTAFPLNERKLFHICGFLPDQVSTLEQQITRTYANYSKKNNDMEKYIFLRSLQDRNETLFYALVNEHIEEMVPIIYTPTVGLACQTYSHIFRFTRGIFISPDNIDIADVIFSSLPYRNIEMIVVTDSEGILGIGDQGVGGMGIPVGKLSLYVAGAGIRPANCLPITLDVGTNNPKLLNDPLYLGIRKQRISGKEYFDFIDQFVAAVKRSFKNVILQWEDFSKQNAFTLKDRYQEEITSFNDDIQGTGSVVLAGIFGALKIKKEQLTQQRFVVLGAGAGGMGVALQIHTALMEENLTSEEAANLIYVLDSRGVIHKGRSNLETYKLVLAKDENFAENWTVENPSQVNLLETINHVKPTVMLGLSGVPNSFSEEVIRTCQEHCEVPIIFPLSNPTSNSEATPEDIYKWTDGKAIVATGSPFAPVVHKGRPILVGQGNNVFIFPGVGFGSLLIRARRITDEMFTAAARRLAELVPETNLSNGSVYPPMTDLRMVSKEIAKVVAIKAMEQKVAAYPIAEELLDKFIEERMWTPEYARYTKSGN